jgi:hypothetical protein
VLPPAGAAQELLIVLLDVGGHMHPHLPAVGEALFNAALSKARRGPGGAAAPAGMLARHPDPAQQRCPRRAAPRRGPAPCTTLAHAPPPP